MPTLDRTLFFANARGALFGGRLRQEQVDGCNAILDRWESDYPDADRRWLAYLLGTAFHETAQRMAPIHEFGSSAYFERRYGPGTRVGRELGNACIGDGARFHGRGFVQLTGRRNYAHWSRRLSIDLLGEPDLVLEPEIAARILVEGSVRGTFTGRSLGDYFNEERDDWHHARRIINGLDRAAHIAGLGRRFLTALGGNGTVA